MFRTARLLARSLLLLALVALPAAAQNAPAIWHLSRGDSQVYLFGTIHLLKADTPWRSGTLDALFAGADSLTVEAEIDRIDPLAMQQTLMRVGYYPPGETLADHVPAEMRDRLLAEAGKIGLPAQAVDRMRPWLIGLTLTATLAQQAGFLQQYGVDVTLIGEARATGKEVRALETAEEQIETLASLDDDAQIAWLREGLDQLADLGGAFERMKTAWLEADTATLGEIMTEGMEDNAQLAERLLYARNRNWLPQVEALLATPGTHFVAVGAGHLVGEQSLIDLLETAGHEVTRY